MAVASPQLLLGAVSAKRHAEECAVALRKLLRGEDGQALALPDEESVSCFVTSARLPAS